jgi:hypothetical protein
MKYQPICRYIMTRDHFPKIVGRVYGGDGSATYQLAARPNDECPAHGHASIEAAFDAAVKVLEERAHVRS